jgi:hypothetical protein
LLRCETFRNIKIVGYRSVATVHTQLGTMTTLSSGASPSSPALLMEDGLDTVTNVILHPLALLHVLDHHTRRQEVSGRVIGTLLGRRDGRTVRDIIFTLVKKKYNPIQAKHLVSHSFSFLAIKYQFNTTS